MEKISINNYLSFMNNIFLGGGTSKKNAMQAVQVELPVENLNLSNHSETKLYMYVNFIVKTM